MNRLYLDFVLSNENILELLKINSLSVSAALKWMFEAILLI
ncbi:hypothetical protein LEP1GSC133_0451 [Leptospira borgpetersenii serovar Pomona str. 200901868]|uniref:Uncharacterized protein n=1 Tax=Leptospira borgpetersenii serovar Pomona str. 200901868 TaxID=1192866 RepID=M6W2N4_LEPBO|nr:hypothetical protein LEP1GSC133_0451 [Leptospira borgpetersenii serovar Pomona str. 200901868]